VVLGIIHDLAESVVGDIPTFAGFPKGISHRLDIMQSLLVTESKRRLESNGLRYLANLTKEHNLGVAHFLQEAWLDYEYGRTPEGLWMRDMDKFECLLQAGEYEDQTHGEKDMEEFQGLAAKVSSPEGRHWANLAQRYRNARIEERSQSRLIIFITGLHPP
jgi:5'-deoxynucleotidase YfbR-like HD superfamily hydrolase